MRFLVLPLAIGVGVWRLCSTDQQFCVSAPNTMQICAISLSVHEQAHCSLLGISLYFLKGRQPLPKLLTVRAVSCHLSHGHGNFCRQKMDDRVESHATSCILLG